MTGALCTDPLSLCIDDSLSQGNVKCWVINDLGRIPDAEKMTGAVRRVGTGLRGLLELGWSVEVGGH